MSPMTQNVDPNTHLSEILSLQLPPAYEAVYTDPESKGYVFRRVIAIGKAANLRIYEACVLDDTGRLVLARAIEGFQEVSEAGKVR